MLRQLAAILPVLLPFAQALAQTGPELVGSYELTDTGTASAYIIYESSPDEPSRGEPFQTSQYEELESSKPELSNPFTITEFQGPTQTVTA